MQNLVPFIKKFIASAFLIFTVYEGRSQAANPPVFNLTDFAVWGGSALPQNYQAAQGVIINNNIKITGNVGSNHLISVKNDFKLTGSIISGNSFIANNNAAVTGNIFAAKRGNNFTGNVISFVNNSKIVGNISANGKVVFKNANTVSSGPARYHLYPNPASSVVRLQVKGDEQHASKIEVYDLVGKLYTPSIQRINSGMYELNISSLAKGIYLIKVKNAAGVKTFRFVKI